MYLVKVKSDFPANRMEYLYDAMKQKKHCDTIFTVRNRSFYVHLVVLSACSEFFGRNKDKLSETFSPFEFEVIDAMLKYCYTGGINIEEKYYKKFTELANLLEVKIPPRYRAIDYCLEVLRLTDNLEMKRRAMNLTLDNFEILYKTRDFLNLPVSTVIDILKSDVLIVPSEEDVFNAVKLWVNHDDTNRKNNLVQLMSSVRLSFLSTEFLVNEVMKFCNSCADCMTSIRQEVLNKNNQSLIQRETLRGKKEKIVLIGGEDLNMAHTIDIYDGEKKSWSLSTSIGTSIDKYHFASVVVEDWIVTIGGLNGGALNSVEYIDLKNGQIYPLKPLNQARWDFAAVTLRGDSSTDIYAIGGASNSVERWNSKTEEWEIIAPLLVAVTNHSASVIDRKIYVTGGQTYGNGKEVYTNKVQVYSVETNTWTYCAEMIHGRYNHSSAVLKGKLLVAGGYGLKYVILDSVEQYDPVENLWSVFTRLPKPVIGISLCCFQNKILSMGGLGKKYYWDVYEYDEISKSWKENRGRLNKFRIDSAAHVIPHHSII
ncbi:kelch-like protein 7 [Arctopsyche grandis]|uniref:kelch-like protein 7 n=1 Tax=Arctopsyche grandis TaxID=121162 RepID=UPI00406D657F